MEMKDQAALKGFSTPLVIGIVVVVAALAAFLFLRDSTPDTAPEDAPVEMEGEEGTSVTEEDAEVSESDAPLMEESLDEAPVREIALEAGSFYYAPNEIRVKAGERVRVTMTSKDMMHDFNIDELGVKVPVTQAGNSATVEFFVDTPGTYEYYCSVGNHRQMGQKGMLIVE